jgi:hypothetical protein
MTKPPMTLQDLRLKDRTLLGASGACTFTSANWKRSAPRTRWPKTTTAPRACGLEFRPLPADRKAVVEQVQRELIELGLVERPGVVESVSVKYCPSRQVIYDHNRRLPWAQSTGSLTASEYQGRPATPSGLHTAGTIAEHLANRKKEPAEFEIDD